MKNRIKIIRAEQNLTQEALAKKANITRTALAMIENDKATPDGETIAKLVEALNTPANKIFFALDVVCTQQQERTTSITCIHNDGGLYEQ